VVVIPLFFLLTRAVTAADFILCTILAGPLSWTGSLAGALPWVGILAGPFPWVAIASSVGSPSLNARQSVVGDSVTDKLVSSGSNCRQKLSYHLLQIFS